jgi:hypothetical protein
VEIEKVQEILVRGQNSLEIRAQCSNQNILALVADGGLKLSQRTKDKIRGTCTWSVSEGQKSFEATRALMSIDDRDRIRCPYFYKRPDKGSRPHCAKR